MASNENSGGKVDLSQYSKKFETESEIEESRKKRQEEWERVRQPHQPKEAPAEAPEDRRCLFDKLQEQKDLKQAEHDDKYALKNLVRGYDDEEADFLKSVQQLKEDQEKNKQDEEDQLMAEFRSNVSNQVIDMDKSEARPSTRSQKPVEQKHKSQSQLLAGAIKRKRTSSTADEHENGKESTTAVVPDNSNAVARVVAILPGIGVYTDSDDSDSSSDSEIDTDFFKRAKGSLQDVHGH